MCAWERHDPRAAYSPTHPLLWRERAHTGESASVVALGSDHTCVIVSGGGIKCWGGNGHGQLGIGNTTGDHARPMDVVGIGSGVYKVCGVGGWVMNR